MRYSRLIVFILSILLFSSSAFAEKVVKVIDGDSILFENDRHVRLFGVDAPEWEQPYGKTAKIYLENLIDSQEVFIGQCYDHPDDRDVCKVMIKNEGTSLDIGQELVKAGFAMDYPKYSKNEYADAEQQAKSDSKGMWNAETAPEKPWKFRHRNKKHHYKNNKF